MSGPVITVKQGDLRGIKVKSVTGRSYITFKGIPYAAPPVGDLRFRDPQPPLAWTGVRDASVEGPKCAQYDIYTQKMVGDDDCLYLNVATTSLTESRPVMVWIHGGAFLFGDGGYDIYGPDYLMDADVVYVGINYRLGVLGFLHLDHEVAPGNAGLKDQVAALKWVKENIGQFGGDPNNVTIFGESAGGVSVHYLLLSPLAKNLFHKAIIQSGVMLNLFAFTSVTVDRARTYVAALGRDINDPEEIVKYLRTVPVSRLVEVQINFMSVEDQIALILPFVPGVDDKSSEPFMPTDPRELAAEGFDVPVIIGHTSHEGIFFLSSLFWSEEVKARAFEKLTGNFEMALPRDLAALAPSKVSKIAENLKKFYIRDDQTTTDIVDVFVQYYGDRSLVFGIHKCVDIQRRKKSPTYLYRFSYEGANPIHQFLCQVQAKGTMHCEDLHFLFFANQLREFIEKNFGPEEKIVRDRFVRMWTDFAKTGNPTPLIDDLITQKWEPVTEMTKNYLEINAELSAGVDPVQDVWEVWNRAYAIADDLNGHL